METSLEIGSLVESIMGRDKNTIYMVADITNNGKIVLVNGDTRTFSHPKIKNAKHVKQLGFVVSHLKEKMQSNKNIFDAEVYSSIKKYKLNGAN